MKFRWNDVQDLRRFWVTQMTFSLAAASTDSRTSV